MTAVTLPYLTHELPGTGGVLRAAPEDFVVDEEPAYAPAGQGDHVFARFEKRGLTTRDAVARISRALAVAERDVGVAGLKDRHAVTTQWISLPPPIAPEAVLALVLDDIRVLEAVRHPHKLRTGHVRANRFALRVRGAVPDAAARGRAIVLGERPPRDKKLARLLVSALQSELFNAWLVARLADGLYARVLTGDVLHKRGGGMFTCEDAATDQERLDAGELVVTGPMFGDRMRAAAGDAGTREAQILATAGLAADSFASVRALAEGTRRDATIDVGSPSVTEIATDAIEVCFTLPGGAYATAVMREVMKSG